MNINFLNTICESCLVKNGIQSKIKNIEEFNKIKSHTVNEVHTILNELFHNDILMYHMFIDKPRYVQYKIIENYLSMCYSDSDVLEETIIGITSGVLLGLIFAHKPLAKLVAKGLASIGRVADTIGTFIANQGKEWKLRYSIIYQNLEECYKEAGVKPEDLSAWHTATINDDPYMPQMSVSAVKETEKLKECYVKYQIATISQLFKAYFLCLQKTGDASTIAKLRDDDLMKVISGLQLSTVCKEYYDMIKTSFDNFYALLDLIYDKESKKSEKLTDLKNALIVAKEFGQKQGGGGFGQKPSFNKDFGQKPSFNKDFGQKPSFNKDNK